MLGDQLRRSQARFIRSLASEPTKRLSPQLLSLADAVRTLRARDGELYQALRGMPWN